MDPIFVPSSPEEGSETKRTEAHGRKKWIPFLSRLHPGGGGRKNEARRRRMVGVDALGDPSCANPKHKPAASMKRPLCGHGERMGSVFVSASSEKDLKNEACSNPLPPGARTKHVPSLHHRGRGTAPAVEGVRLSLLTERKCCAFCEKHGRRNQESDCDHFGDFLRISSTPDAPILFAIRRMYQANSFRRPYCLCEECLKSPSEQ